MSNTVLTIDKFWMKANDIHDLYYSRSRHAILTDEEQLSDVSDFLADMETLAGEWHNRSS